MTPIMLGLIAVALALPVPAALARMHWPMSVPRAGIVLWQSLALAAILAIFGAGLSTALWLVSEPAPSLWRIAAHFLVMSLTIIVGSRLAWSMWTVWRETRQRRRRQRHLVDLLGSTNGMAPALRVLQEQTPIAYCVPSRGGSRVVVSRGTIEALNSTEFDAVLEHERAHVRSRHDLVLEGFSVLHRAFPKLLRTDAPLVQSQIMVELLADDAARKVTGEIAVARALVALAGAPTPVGALGVGSAAQIRMNRLSRPIPRNRTFALAAYAFSAIVLIGPTVFLALPWIAHAWQTLTP